MHLCGVKGLRNTSNRHTCICISSLNIDFYQEFTGCQSEKCVEPDQLASDDAS